MYNVLAMKALILAAGYGTRFCRDLESHKDDYKDLIGVPKPLLPIAGHPLITHWVHMLEKCPEVSDTYVVVNVKYYGKFESWSKEFSQVQLVCDGSSSNEERLGAVACIQVAIQQFQIQDDLIVIGGDTLFFDDFVLGGFISKFLSSSAGKEDGAMVPCYKCRDEDTCKVGIVEVNDTGRITSFLEKPLTTATTSRLACPCFYLFSRDSLNLIPQFLDEKKDSPLKERDATGHFLRYLSERRAVYTSMVAGRYDVGGLESYLECCRLYKLPIAT